MSTDDFENMSPNDIEDLVIKACFKKTEIGNKVFPIMIPELFTDDNQKIVKKIKEFYDEKERYPRTRELFDFYLDGSAKDRFEEIGKINLSHYSDDFLTKQIENYLRGKLTLLAMQRTFGNWKTNDFHSINQAVEEIKKAVNFTIDTKMGVSVKKDFDSLMSYLQLKIKKVPSPYKTLNALIDGGHPAKAVSMYFGESNIGKTTFLCNDAAFAISNGFNALYITLEMPDFEIFKKIAANILEIEVNQLKNCNILDVKNKINSLCTGDLKIIEYPSFEMTAHDLRNILQELDYKEKFKPDIIFIDYVNCMISAKDSGGKRHEDLGYIMKELENVAKHFDVPIVSCSQLNRDGYGTLEVSAKNIGESIDIIKYCANGYAIMRDTTMKTKGLFLVKILKNRYGANDLQFYLKGNMAIMKIRDASRDETESALSSMNMQNVVDDNGEAVQVISDGNG